MQAIQLNDRLSAATQPASDDFARLAAAGVTTVINNRPDGEEPGQLGAAEAASLAEGAGIAYHHLPVGGGLPLTRETVERFGALVDEAEGPVVAHCRSGTRSTMLWVLREVLAGRMKREDVVPFGRERGLDLRAALGWLDEAGA